MWFWCIFFIIEEKNSVLAVNRLYRIKYKAKNSIGCGCLYYYFQLVHLCFTLSNKQMITIQKSATEQVKTCFFVHVFRFLSNLFAVNRFFFICQSYDIIRSYTIKNIVFRNDALGILLEFEHLFILTFVKLFILCFSFCLICMVRKVFWIQTDFSWLMQPQFIVLNKFPTSRTNKHHCLHYKMKIN